MKNLKLFLLIPVMLFVFSLHAQELSRSVFASSGETSTNGELKLSWTIGQSGLVGTFTQDFHSLNVGFQQYDLLGTFIEENKNQGILRVFPNPFLDAFFINFQPQSKGLLNYYVYDNMGKLVLQKNNIRFGNYTFEEAVMFSGQAQGIYNLILYFFPENQNPTQQSIKLIKQ